MKISKKLDKLSKLLYQFNELEKEISDMLANHLGYGWFIENSTDGLVLVDPDSNQYTWLDYDHIFTLSKDKAIEYISSGIHKI